ncbi:unnamed protein product [Dracunculus medinensis]|uniref:U3 small nucleolar RNA-associated protein 11 n=1 Tax=Dracunculus medinensis TaxID=318479 RepID=A0A0N4U819_DRAME|nr:unnamed protein product [Dracunculus medinensis]
MSSLKRAAKCGQRLHRERPQPESRAHLGHLERKKDYKKRANDYNRKKAKLLKLRQRALDRNPDEFHFHMIRSRIANDGSHREFNSEADEDTLLQKKLADLNNFKYVKYKLNIENKVKIEKLKSILHFADMTTASQNTHTIFVDDDEIKSFDPVQYFDTTEELIDRTFNRPRLSVLKKEFVNVKSRCEVEEAEKERKLLYKELIKRMQRAKELKIVIEKLETRKNISGNSGPLKPKKVSRGELMKAPVYKWVYERKK